MNKMAKSRILIVDDNSANLESLSDFLGIDYTVDTAGSSTGAFDKVKKNKYGAVILDVKMPDIDGIELYKKMKEYDNSLKAIFYSAYPGEYQKARECNELGLYVRKGKVEDLEILLSSIEKVLGENHNVA